VLVVEDNPVCREVLRSQVEFLGWRADTAENGAEALALLARGRYRLLLTDCRMPVMDGFQLVRAIRAGERRRPGPRLPVVAVTSENLAAYGNACDVLGIDDYLDKSLDEEALARVLEKWLGAVSGEAFRPAAAVGMPALECPGWR
jgi:CheY-like chemotaxis protein